MRFGLTLILALSVVGSCTSSADEKGPDRLVVIGAEGEIVTMDPDGANRQLVAEREEGAGFFQPVWSPGGERLAWGYVDESGPSVAIAEGEALERVPTDDLPFYLSWAPDGSRLGILHNRSGGGIEFVVIDADTLTSSPVANGAPFYFSWDPDSQAVIAHIGSRRFDRLGIDGSQHDLGPTDAGYLAPFVTSRGIVHLVDGDIVLADRPIAAVPGNALFVANRDGTRIAVMVPGGAITVADVPTIPSGRLVVVDTGSGEDFVVTDLPVIGFFWSPSGERLLALVVDGETLSPIVWSPDGDVATYPAFTPSQSLVRDFLPFFPQYAQSVSLWAPDGTAFTYPGDIDGQTGIWVQELDSEDSALVGDGTWVSWSP